MYKVKKKLAEPEYGLSQTHIKTLNYKVHYLTAKEKLIYSLIAFCVGAAIGYLFYGGIGKDDYGNYTKITYVLNFFIPVVVGFVAIKLFLPIRAKSIIEKRRSDLSVQFRDMLDGVTTSLGAGNNVINSFTSVYNDLKVQYTEDAYILKELEIVLSEIQSNIEIEDVLDDFGERSGISDIKSFANVFRICYRKGGNIQEVIRNTHQILSQKMAIEEDIKTTVSGSKLDQLIMLILPIILVALIKMMSPDFASNFVSATGIISTTIAVVLFVVAYFVGKMIMSIKV